MRFPLPPSVHTQSLSSTADDTLSKPGFSSCYNRRKAAGGGACPSGSASGSCGSQHLLAVVAPGSPRGCAGRAVVLQGPGTGGWTGISGRPGGDTAARSVCVSGVSVHRATPHTAHPWSQTVGFPGETGLLLEVAKSCFSLNLHMRKDGTVFSKIAGQPDF